MSTTIDEGTLLATLPRVFTHSGDGRTPVPDAATRETIAWVAPHTQADVAQAIADARTAQRSWATAGTEARNVALLAAADEIDARAEELARILSRETGKPLNGPNARFEVGACALWLRSTAHLELTREQLYQDGDKGAYLEYEPLGVVGVIGPWNWPMMIAVWQIAPALKMGNSVVIKPSEYTPLSILALVEVINRHLPDGVVQTVVGDGALGAELVSDSRIDKIMFTGSTATGRRIVEASANNLARLTLELGGNDPAIVLPDADPDAIAEGLFWGAFVNTGQTCAAIKRLYVHESLHDRVVEKLATLATTMPVGVGLDESSVLGPLQNQRQFDIVADLVSDAIAGGGVVAAGGAPAVDKGPLFFAPTIITGVGNGVRLVDEEQFGPALPVISYTNLDDAIEWANAGEQGLAASVWGADAEQAKALAARIEAGTVWINQHAAPHPLVPFGGVKGSGYGLEFGTEGLKAVARPKVISY